MTRVLSVLFDSGQLWLAWNETVANWMETFLSRFWVSVVLSFNGGPSRIDSQVLLHRGVRR